MRRLLKIYKDIKEVKIQGATNIAREAIKAYYMKPDKKNKNELINLRPTEPMLFNAINLVDKWPRGKIIKHFEEAQNKINT